MSELAGKVSVVTGGAGEIGQAIVDRLARLGSAIAILDRDPSRLKDAAHRFSFLGGRLLLLQVDVSKADEVEEAADTLRQRLGPPDILINNAGISGTGKVLVDLSVAEWEEMIRVDLSSVFHCCRAFVPGMIKRRSGTIVNMASTTGITGMAGSTHYAAAKAGVIGLTKALALELAPFAIAVNAVAPGVIDTELTRRRWGAAGPPSIPWPRIGRVEEVAELVAFLVGPKAGFLTGQVISPNGGQVT